MHFTKVGFGPGESRERKKDQGAEEAEGELMMMGPACGHNGKGSEDRGSVQTAREGEIHALEASLRMMNDSKRELRISSGQRIGHLTVGLFMLADCLT